MFSAVSSARVINYDSGFCRRYTRIFNGDERSRRLRNVRSAHEKCIWPIVNSEYIRKSYGRSVVYDDDDGGDGDIIITIVACYIIPPYGNRFGPVGPSK